jgi:hypothetical protein
VKSLFLSNSGKSAHPIPQNHLWSASFKRRAFLKNTNLLEKGLPCSSSSEIKLG